MNCEQPLREKQHWFKSVFINDAASTELISFYIKQGQVIKVEWGVGRRGRKRDREQWINGVRDGAKEIIGNGMGGEMTAGKDT
jgi:hypothetical protein